MNQEGSPFLFFMVVLFLQFGAVVFLLVLSFILGREPKEEIENHGEPRASSD